jgi:hypothetical protein
MNGLAKALSAEFIDTFALIFFGVCAVTAENENNFWQNTSSLRRSPSGGNSPAGAQGGPWRPDHPEIDM